MLSGVGVVRHGGIIGGRKLRGSKTGDSPSRTMSVHGNPSIGG
jgi:hypothetical protein